MTNTITFTVERDILQYMSDIAHEHGVYFNYTVEPTKVKHCVFATVNRDIMVEYLNMARQYMKDGHDYLPYAEAYRALYGHHPQRLPR